jgi:quinoprotein glucose dehydrogenase
MWGISPIDQMICRINSKPARYAGPYTPPELGRRNIEYPGYNGGSTGAALPLILTAG